jgi:signal transduction histidine kinase
VRSATRSPTSIASSAAAASSSFPRTYFDRYTAQTGIRVQFAHVGLDRRFRPEIETAAYRIVQEALTHVARHAPVAEVD